MDLRSDFSLGGCMQTALKSSKGVLQPRERAPEYSPDFIIIEWRG
jgi:hypothetical protein